MNTAPVDPVLSAPVEELEPVVVETPKPRFSKNVQLALLLGALVAVLGVGYGLGRMSNMAPAGDGVNQLASEPASPAPSSTPAPSVVNLPISLSDYLKQNCQKIGDDKRWLDYLPEDKALLSIPESYTNVGGFLPAGLNPPSPANCILYEAAAGSHYQIRGAWNLFVYDDESEELGHGGSPFLGEHGLKVGTVDGVDYYAFAEFTSSGGPVKAEYMALEMRAIKTFPTTAGKPLYVVTTKRVYDIGDPILVKALEKYTMEEGNGFQKMQSEVAKSFYPTLEALQQDATFKALHELMTQVQAK